MFSFANCLRSFIVLLVHRSDRFRLLAEANDLIDGMSGATRSPGKYKISWDGTDNAKKPLPAGTYTLYVEAAREHGTYQLMKQDIEVGKSLKKKLKGNQEIKTVSLDYQAITEK